MFGDSVSFDITYNIIKPRTKENSTWGLGVFSGLDNNLRIVIFGIALLSSEKT